MEKTRCAWVNKDQDYIDYHDNEWGKPVKDDKILFEFLILESFQAGLSWFTILKKRENFRKAFADFDVKKVAKFDIEDFEKQWLKNPQFPMGEAYELLLKNKFILLKPQSND